MKIQKVALIGAGAVGSYFVSGLAGKPEIDFTLIAEGERKKRLSEGLRINGQLYMPPVRTPKEAGCADLVLIAVKYAAVREAAALASGLVAENTIVLSLLNGIDSEEIVGEYIGKEHIMLSLMRIQSSRTGRECRFDPDATAGLFFGEPETGEETERERAVEELFDGTGIRCTRVADMRGEMWNKFAGNIASNLPQAMVGAGYGAYRDSEHVAWMRRRLNEEVHAVAGALGIVIPKMSEKAARNWKGVEKAARFSTLQDLDAGRHTEVDMFLGVLIRLAKEHDVPVPYSEFAYHMIKALEEKNDGLFDYA